MAEVIKWTWDRIPESLVSGASFPYHSQEQQLRCRPSAWPVAPCQVSFTYYLNFYRTLMRQGLPWFISSLHVVTLKHGQPKWLCQDHKAPCQEQKTRTHSATRSSGFSCSSPREQEAMRSCLMIPKKTVDNFLALSIYYLRRRGKKRTWSPFAVGAPRRKPIKQECSWNWEGLHLPHPFTETLP